MSRPDPYSEIRLVSLASLRGANLWSRRPVTRMDVAPGAYDDLSSAQVPGFTEALVDALPGLWEHRCSVGERGGFVTRLRDGTYAPHIAEHVALELQSMIGHEVGYGRARGGDRPGEYTVVFEHLHSGVGMRCAALALEMVQRACAGMLDRGMVESAVTELAAIARTPDAPPLDLRVLCGVTGGGDRAGVRAEMMRRGASPDELVMDVAPSYLLTAGLPYAHARLAVILDAAPVDVPARYRDPELASRLVSVPADAVGPGGVAICQAGEWEVQELARRAGCRVAVFSADGELTERDARAAWASAWIGDGRIVIEREGSTHEAGVLDGGSSPAAQVAAALAVWCLGEMRTGDGAFAAEEGDAVEER
jgi:cyanophycin synthetase